MDELVKSDFLEWLVKMGYVIFSPLLLCSLDFSLKLKILALMGLFY